MHLKNLKDSGLQSSFSTRAYVASCACVDGDGKRLFTEADIVALSESNAAALDRLLEAVVVLSGISPDSVEDAEKNYDGGLNGSGGSGSPRGSGARSKKSKGA
jgi:hypothetical protein